MIHFADVSLNTLIQKDGHACNCGRHHHVKMDYLSICSGAVREIPQALGTMGTKRPFIVCDANTRDAGWKYVQPVLEEAGISYVFFCFPMEKVEPNEEAMGSLIMHFDPQCDCVMGIGSGVINDCCKVLAHALGRKMMIVGTAPSMDGFASNCSAMIRQGVKCTLNNASADAIICDVDIIRNAPMRMLQAGLGDMLAKYVALCEWRMASVINGEYYCQNVAELMRSALRKITAHVSGLRKRDPDAVQSTVEGLVLSGIAMSYVGSSRPASGFEHYFSHLWEMMALERGIPFELHGIQVGVGTLQALRIFDVIRTLRPDREKAYAFIQSFDQEMWNDELRRILGKTGETVIALERDVFHNNDVDEHAVRIERIVEHWEDILRFMDEELPSTNEIERIMEELGMAMTPEEIGFTYQDMTDAFHAARDTRKKYLTSSMLWDMGVLYEMELPR